MDDIHTLCPAPRRVAAGGQIIEVTPIRVRELAAFAAAMQPLAHALAAGAELPELLALHTGELIAAVAVGARVDPAFIEGLGLDELLDLAEAVTEVNADFFVHRLAPRLTQAAARVSTTLAAAGSSSTPASAPPASAGSPT
jgi:hypothetical protein